MVSPDSIDWQSRYSVLVKLIVSENFSLFDQDLTMHLVKGQNSIALKSFSHYSELCPIFDDHILII